MLTQDDVRIALQAQVEAWNAGDIEGFVARCAEAVLYLAADGPVVGRERLAESYRARYPDRAAMGRLALDVDRVEVRSDTAVAVVRWSIDTGRGGWALLVFGRFDGAWLLTHDATLLSTRA